jgi:hypothetical protein
MFEHEFKKKFSSKMINHIFLYLFFSFVLFKNKSLKIFLADYGKIYYVIQFSSARKCEKKKSSKYVF